MNKLSALQLEDMDKLNDRLGYLSDLIEQLYDMSCLDDMITGGCLDRDDDEMLLCNLSLKSEIMDVLENRKQTIKDLKSIITDSPKMSDVAQKPAHHNSVDLTKYYDKAK